MRAAAVDIGTNSVRLLIAETDGPGGFQTLDRQSRVVRLGQGVDRTGRLAEEAIKRTVAAVADYVAAWRDAGVRQVRISATSAARDAENAATFSTAIHTVAGVGPEVLSGEDEGRLAFAGATADMDPGVGPFVVLDIGGGSTEMVIGQVSVERQTSRQLGSVRLTERVLTDDPPSSAQIEEAGGVIAVQLEAMGRLVAPDRASTLIAVAGTATTLAAVHGGLDDYVDGRVHGWTMTAAQVRALAERLLGSSAADIGRLGAVQQGREDVLAAGAMILSAVIDRFDFPEVVISEADALDGMVLEMFANSHD